MKLNKDYEKDYLIKGIRNGTFYVILCEPLAECFRNYLHCPNKEECEEVESIVDGNPNNPFCGNCQSEEWLVVGVSIEKEKLGNGVCIEATCAPNFGKYMKDLIEEFR